MIEKEKFERHLRGTNLSENTIHRINLPSNSMGINTMMSPRKSYVSTRYG